MSTFEVDDFIQYVQHGAGYYTLYIVTADAFGKTTKTDSDGVELVYLKSSRSRCSDYKLSFWEYSYNCINLTR